jgi:hypothetical protein
MTRPGPYCTAVFAGWHTTALATRLPSMSMARVSA